jgi:peptidoglycan hydrolase-like protein with peptidoglycan-binding domain
MSSSIRKAISVGFIVTVLTVASLGFGMTARAETSTAQLTQIQTLLKLIEQLQAQLVQMQGGGRYSQSSYGGNGGGSYSQGSYSEGSSVGQCIQLSRSLFLGVSDSEIGGEVSKLQQFLTKAGHYTYGKATGYFGPATQMAVQAWQKANGVVSNGSPETTGYGVTGPSTRSAMAKACKFIQTPDNIIVSISSISNSENPTISGNAQGVEKVSLTIHPSDKYSNGNTAVVYDSGDIKVINGKWSHKILFDLVDAKYFVTVKVNGGDISEKSFMVDTDSAEGFADSVTITSISNNPNPTIKGTATGVNKIHLKVSKGEKSTGLGGVVYDSEDISDVRVINGKWSHKVLEYLENGIYTLTIYIDNEYGQNLEIAQRTFKIDDPQSDGDIKAILEVLPSQESKMIALSDTNQVIGKELIAFTIDADLADRDVELSGMTVSLALPFVKAGVWTDMIKNIILVSEKTQHSVNMSESIDSDKNTITLAGQAYDEILVIFNTDGSPNNSFTIPKGTSREFRIIADFNPANVVGEFGSANSIGQSTGYVQANIEGLSSNVPIFTEPGNDMRGRLFSIKGLSY